MTEEQIKILKLGIAPINERTILLVESALHWVLDNTSLEFDLKNNEELEALHPNVRLFILKYFDAMSIQAGIASESISGLSQSYKTDTASDMIWQYAEELLGAWLCSRVRFVSAKRKWRGDGH